MFQIDLIWQVKIHGKQYKKQYNLGILKKPKGEHHLNSIEVTVIAAVIGPCPRGGTQVY